MTAPSDDDLPRPTLSRGFWLMMALSGLSLAAAAYVVFRNPKPVGAAPANAAATASSPSVARRSAPGVALARNALPVDWADIESWQDEGAGLPATPVSRVPGAPTEAVEVDDDFGAALQPSDGGSLLAEAADLLRALGEWTKGR